ncbi:MAG: Gfo/Idh/MocA family oxidoreductase [Acidobacteria bacterium]|nr:Gfo/Idh/MocA family oxidoreductase [Acidobacteriota bacterium]
MGHCYATVIHNHPHMSLEAVIDPNPEAAKAFRHSFRCKSYGSVQDYLAAGHQAEGAVICTPPVSHAGIATQLLENRTHTLCEPPLALDPESAEKMKETARRCAATLMMGSKFRFVADVIQAKGLIQAGILGHVLEFEGDFRETVDMTSRWNVQPEISGGGVLMDSGPLAVDVVRYLFGPIQAIRAEEGRRVQSKEVEDTVRLELSTEPGILGTLHLSWALKNNGEDYFRIYGTQGNMCIGWRTSFYRPTGAADWIHFGEGYSTQKALGLQLSHFMDVVSGEEVPEITAEEELASVRVIETAYRSLATGRHMHIGKADPDAARARKLSLISSSSKSFPTWIFNR